MTLGNYRHTITVPSWRDIPQHIRSDCMERISAGVFGHARLGVAFVCVDEANTVEAVSVLVDEVRQRVEARSRRVRVKPMVTSESGPDPDEALMGRLPSWS